MLLSIFSSWQWGCFTVDFRWPHLSVYWFSFPKTWMEYFFPGFSAPPPSSRSVVVQSDQGSIASLPQGSGIRNKHPACWVQNNEIFFCARQSMSRSVLAVGLKMGLSFGKRSVNLQWGDVAKRGPLGVTMRCIHLSPRFHLLLFSSFNLLVGLLHPTASMHYHFFERDDLRTLAFAERKPRNNQSAIDFVSNI